MHERHQNQITKLMVLTIYEINVSRFYVIMTDEVMDTLNTEQFIIHIRWIYADLDVYEEFIGPSKVDNITASTLTNVLKDVLLRSNIPIKNCRGQCYDGTSNMMGIKSVVARQIC